MSLLLLYHDTTSLVLCSDRAQDAAARFLVLPGGVVSALGRADVCRRLLAGSAKLVAANPQLRFAELSGTFFPALKQAFDERPAPQTFDRVVGVVCGWDREASKMRVLSARKTKCQFTCSENVDPVAHAECFSANVNPQHILVQMEHAIQSMPAANRTREFICESMAFTLRQLARLQPHVSANATFAAFEKDQRISLPAEFAAPPVSGPSSDEKTRN